MGCQCYERIAINAYIIICMYFFWHIAWVDYIDSLYWFS